MRKTCDIRTNARQEMIDITSMVQKAVSEAGVTDGIAICFVPHTTAAVTINENADPDVRRDILDKLSREIPQQDGYHHAEGNSDAHLKTSLVGSSEHILIENGNLILGIWQSVFFCEFDGPRTRNLIIKVSSLG
jgi:secondary thiamine-phosphate synthase enzyme